MALDPERSAQIVKAKNMLAEVSFAPLDPLPEPASGAYLGSLALTVVGSMKEALGACPEVPGAERTLAAALERCLPFRARVEALSVLPAYPEGVNID